MIQDILKSEDDVEYEILRQLPVFAPDADFTPEEEAQQYGSIFLPIAIAFLRSLAGDWIKDNRDMIINGIMSAWDKFGPSNTVLRIAMSTFVTALVDMLSN